METSHLPEFEDVLNARERLGQQINRTPVFQCSALSSLSGSHLFFKCENFQKTGSFKARGAMNAVSLHSSRRDRREVVTHSSGNHGQAVAFAASRFGVSSSVVMPRNAVAAKKSAVASYGGKIVECGTGASSRAEAAGKVVEETGGVFIHPYNDAQVISGQATCALEFLDQVPDLQAIITPVGGGGLISGTCLATANIAPGAKVFGAEPSQADDARKSLEAGKIVIDPPPDTIADGLRSSIGEMNWHFIENFVDEIVTATEEGIIDAMRLIWQRMKLIIEPSSAVVLAAILESPEYFAGKRVGIILSGGNVDLDDLPWRGA